MAVEAWVYREGVGAAADFLYEGGCLQSMASLDRPTLLFVYRGGSTLRRGSSTLELSAGEGVAIAAGQCFDRVDHPDDEGVCETGWLAFDPAAVMEHVRDDRPPEIHDLLVLRSPEKEFRAAFRRALDAIMLPDSVPQEIALLRTRECLAWIELHGGRFANLLYHSVSTRVRFLILSSPDRSWGAVEASRRLGMSEATLRRRLASEGQSFSGILRDVRLSRAFSLLQETDRSIEEIAQSVGYESPSRFALRFRLRFGRPPAALRGHPSPPDRFSAELQRR